MSGLACFEKLIGGGAMRYVFLRLERFDTPHREKEEETPDRSHNHEVGYRCPCRAGQEGFQIDHRYEGQEKHVQVKGFSFPANCGWQRGQLICNRSSCKLVF